MSPLTSLLATDRHQIRPKLLPNVLGGLIAGLVSLTYCVSVAALIFTGSLSPFPQGVGSALISSAKFGAIVALCSSFPCAIAGLDANATDAISELPTTLYCRSRSHLQTMRQEHPQVVTVFEDFIIRFLVERLMYAHTDIEELL